MTVSNRRNELIERLFKKFGASKVMAYSEILDGAMEFILPRVVHDALIEAADMKYEGTGGYVFDEQTRKELKYGARVLLHVSTQTPVVKYEGPAAPIDWRDIVQQNLSDDAKGPANGWW